MEIVKTICLCAIVKNEEKVLKRLIDSCRSIIDYWVIIDTGSTDGTLELIRKELKDIPGELSQSEFINFGHNRNEVLQIAKGKADYLLLMDADMTVVLDKDFNKNSLKEEWYMLRYEGELDFAQPLLVKGDIPWRYEGVTHEYIIADKVDRWTDIRSIRLIHHSDGGMRYDKLQRDQRLLEKEISEKPNDARSYFYLGQTLANMGKYDEAIQNYEKRANLGGWKEEVYYSLYQIGVMQYNKKNYDSALLQFLEAYDYRPTRFEALYQIGLMYREQKKYHLASIFFEKIINQKYPTSDVLFIHKNQYNYLADFELAICYYWMEEYEKAKRYAIKVNRNPNLPQSIMDQNDKNYQYIVQKLSIKNDKVNDYIICSMFTINTPYQEEIKHLQKSLDDLNLPYEFVGVKPQGSWIKNTQLKSSVIKGVMDKYNKDVVWVDADAIMRKRPVFFDKVDADLSFYTIDEWREMFNGTIYLKNNKKVHSFLDEWTALNESNNLPDGANFQAILEVSWPKYNIVALPADYAKIFDNDLIKSSDPVIVHNQASRRFKEIVNKPISNEFVRELLFQLIGDKDTCTIVGNGPFKTNLSSKIDNSFVVRCNNFNVNYEGIGNRTDLNISSLYHEIIPDGIVPYPIFGILPISETAYQPYTDAKSMHKFWKENGEKLIANGNQVWMYSDYDSFIGLFKEVCKEINAFPTVGIMGIAMARWMGFKNIILTGFTFFETEKSHYFSEKVTKPSMHHNVSAEKELIKKWIIKDPIKYVCDDLMMSKLMKDATT